MLKIYSKGKRELASSYRNDTKVTSAHYPNVEENQKVDRRWTGLNHQLFFDFRERTYSRSKMQGAESRLQSNVNVQYENIEKNKVLGCS